VGILSVAKGIKSIYYGLKKPMPKVGPTISSLVKKVGSAATTVGTFAAADLLAGQMSKALTGPAGLSMPSLGGLSSLQNRGASMPSVMPDVLDPSVLKTYYRAPKGYVIVRDPASGQVMAVRKAIAKAYHLWKPARKPPISASDWHHYQRNRQLEKKLLKIAGPALRKRSSSRAPVAAKKGR